MSGRPDARWLGATLVALALVAGCASAQAASPTAQSRSTVTVTMSIVCGFTTGTTTVAGDITRYRDLSMTCTVEGSDARVTGTQTGLLSVDMHPDGSAELWHSYRLATADGSWVGAASGLVAAGYTTHRLEARATGTGAYTGLTLHIHVSGDDGIHFAATGTITYGG